MDGNNAIKRYPVVLRFEGLKPSDLGGYEGHRTRRGGDLGHVDGGRKHLNRRLIGDEDWAAKALDEIDAIRVGNFAAELESLEARKRKKDIKRRLAEGPHDPWRPTRHGPMRELILTANKEWFDDDLSGFLGEGGNQRVEEFERLAVGWLTHQFGDDVIHARADLDEQTYHIHAVIMPRVTVEMTRTNKKTGETKVIATRRMLQPSKFEVIEDYEKAQDSVGEWFAELGLVRGERRKQAIRDALTDGREPPAKRRHVRPAEWRQREELRLARDAERLERRKREVEAREAEADGIIGFADAIASGAIDESGREIANDSAQDDGEAAAPGPVAPVGIASAGYARARRAFRAASKRIWRRAEVEAQQQVAKDVAEIRKADAVLAQALDLLPSGLQQRLLQVRRAISARLVGIDRRAQRQDETFHQKETQDGGRKKYNENKR